jgi:hypothetical protein
MVKTFEDEGALSVLDRYREHRGYIRIKLPVIAYPFFGVFVKFVRTSRIDNTNIGHLAVFDPDASDQSDYAASSPVRKRLAVYAWKRW